MLFQRDGLAHNGCPGNHTRHEGYVLFLDQSCHKKRLMAVYKLNRIINANDPARCHLGSSCNSNFYSLVELDVLSFQVTNRKQYHISRIVSYGQENFFGGVHRRCSEKNRARYRRNERQILQAILDLLNLLLQ